MNENKKILMPFESFRCEGFYNRMHAMCNEERSSIDWDLKIKHRRMKTKKKSAQSIERIYLLYKIEIINAKLGFKYDFNKE